MESNNKKESFKLLQLSDDSKSLSDLELPELSNQRKRKIRRKTRNTSPLSRHGIMHGNHHNDSNVVAGACQNFGLWIAIFMSCGWLFILSYMTAVVYTENRRLEVQINKLSATSQTIPDELQNWHETSKFLQQNQTNIFTKIIEIEQRMDSIEKDLKLVQLNLNKKSDESSDHDKVLVLQNNVANFGAKIKDLTIDVDGIKENVRNMKTIEKQTKDNLTDLQQWVKTNSSLAEHAAQTAQQINNETVLAIVHNLTDTYKIQLHSLSYDFNNINDTLSQRTKQLDDDLRVHKTKLDILTENIANITSHVESIEIEMVKLKDANLAVANSSFNKPTTGPIEPSAIKNKERPR